MNEIEYLFYMAAIIGFMIGALLFAFLIWFEQYISLYILKKRLKYLNDETMSKIEKAFDNKIYEELYDETGLSIFKQIYNGKIYIWSVLLKK